MSLMVREELIITRSELYAMVWREPITKVAAKFDRSDTADSSDPTVSLKRPGVTLK
ncbi:MAG: hypothetical protein JWP89_2707 [Schlesneria sp.]|nr:hypothetical protein [Schlesneria sp.]